MATPDVPTLDPAAARAALDAGANLLDVREDWEYADGHIHGAVLIPLWQLTNRMNEVPAPGRPLVVYCAQGQRSAAAVEWLRSNGHADAVNLTGGISRWIAEGQAVE